MLTPGRVKDRRTRSRRVGNNPIKDIALHGQKHIWRRFRSSQSNLSLRFNLSVILQYRWRRLLPVLSRVEMLEIVEITNISVFVVYSCFQFHSGSQIPFLID